MRFFRPLFKIALIITITTWLGACGSGHRPGENFQAPPNWNEGFEFSGGFPNDGMDAGMSSDFFENLFGGAYRSQRSEFHAGGRDHHARVLIDLEDAFKGAKRAIQLKMPKITTDGHVTTELRTLAENAGGCPLSRTAKRNRVQESSDPDRYWRSTGCQQIGEG